MDIYGPAGSSGGRTLEVISQDEDVTLWENTFATDQKAWEEFLATAERDGIEPFLFDEEADILESDSKSSQW